MAEGSQRSSVVWIGGFWLVADGGADFRDDHVERQSQQKREWDAQFLQHLYHLKRLFVEIRVNSAAIVFSQ